MVGQRIGKYRILGRLGAGGMGVVYRAEDERLRRHVAIKLLPPALALEPESRARLEREAQSISALDHPNICTIYEIGEHEGQLFIVMSCYEGQTLRQLMDRGRLPAGQAAFIGAQVARGLERAHEAGIVHRDIKPANVMITTRDEVKLLDFGLAKGRDALNLTAEGALAGTPAYMSPEQVEGRPVDQRADVWALGVMVYEMFAGEPPFRGDSMAALLRSILHDEPEALSKKFPAIEPAIEQAVHQALTRHLESRAPDVRALRAALEGSRHGDAQTLPPPSWAANSRQASSARAAEGSSGMQLKSVAVLPFANRSPDAEQAYFCEGLADELVTGLTRLNRFRVASRSAAMRPGEGGGAAGIGRLLNVDAVLEGSVRRAGQRLRISVQLVEVATGFVIWSERYDRELHDVFEIQEQIAEQVVKGFSGVFGEEDRARLQAGTTESLEAYEHYLRGRTLMRLGRRTSLEAAIESYRRAVGIDPNYAMAYMGIAVCHNWLYADWGGSVIDVQKATEAARKAVELAPNLAEAHAALGIALREQDREASERELKEAIRLNNKSGSVHKEYGDYFFHHGEMERAGEHYQKAIGLDPDLYEVWGFLAMTWKRLGRDEQSMRASQHAFEAARKQAAINPGDARACYMAGISLLRMGQTEQGLTWIDRALAMDGEDLLLLYNIACAYSLAGNAERALDALEKATAAGYGSVGWLEHDSDLDAIRSHPRFHALIGRLRADP